AGVGVALGPGGVLAAAATYVGIRCILTAAVAVAAADVRTADGGIRFALAIDSGRAVVPQAGSRLRRAIGSGRLRAGFGLRVAADPAPHAFNLAPGRGLDLARLGLHLGPGLAHGFLQPRRRLPGFLQAALELLGRQLALEL